MKKTIFIFLVGLVSLTACKKYDEGPLISLRSKEKRLCSNIWHINEITDENTNSVSFNENNTMTFDKNGTMYVYYYNVVEQEFQTDTNQWRFIDDKNNIEVARKDYTVDVDTLQDSIAFVYHTVTVYDTIFIKKLTQKDFWFIWPYDHSPIRYYYYKYNR